jgi:hypothetical protein
MFWLFWMNKDDAEMLKDKKQNHGKKKIFQSSRVNYSSCLY